MRNSELYVLLKKINYSLAVSHRRQFGLDFSKLIVRTTMVYIHIIVGEGLCALPQIVL